jgi:ABC-type oligopeptide transport system ATPase subunit
MSSANSLLSVRGLKKSYAIGGGFLGGPREEFMAVDGLDLDVAPGETLGLVGESGSGKTTTGRCILRLVEPSAGSIEFGGRDVLAMGRSELRSLRSEMQIVFQDPYGSLNPRMTVASALEEPLRAHGIGDRTERAGRVEELLSRVGLSSDHGRRYPHEFSGGQRQRVGIARALALEPRFIVADEPVSALDVSIQAQILNLLKELQEELKVSYLFIAHDLAVVEHISHRVAVMQRGKIVEVGPTRQIIEDPQHEYTRELLAAVPKLR